MCFKMVYSNIDKAKSRMNQSHLELINLKCVTYAQPVPLALEGKCLKAENVMICRAKMFFRFRLQAYVNKKVNVTIISFF